MPILELAQSSPLIETVTRKDYGMSAEEILNGRLARMVSNGLQVITICNHGSGRSYNVAKELTQRGIGSVCLLGGFDGLNEHTDPFSLSPIYYELNQVPNIGIILTKEEQLYYISQINQLRAFRYSSSESAIRSLIALTTDEY